MTSRRVNEADLDAREILQRFGAIEDRLDRGAERMRAIEDDLRANTATTQANQATLQEVRDLLEMGRSGLRLLGALGRLAKWVGTLTTAAAAVWAAIYTVTHGGKPPGP